MASSENSSAQEYRIKVNNSLVDSFFSHPIPLITQAEIREVRKVVLVVFNKYFHKYAYMKRELISTTMAAILERHRNFDPRFRAYNYVYTIARNEIGNRIKKVTKETFTDDLAKDYDRADNNDYGVAEIGEMGPKLAGLFDGYTCDIPKDELQPVLLFIETHVSNGVAESITDRIIDMLIECLYD